MWKNGGGDTEEEEEEDEEDLDLSIFARNGFLDQYVRNLIFCIKKTFCWDLGYDSGRRRDSLLTKKCWCLVPFKV